MNKVLHICYGDLSKGGIQAVIMSIVRGLKKEYEFDVVVFSQKNMYYAEEIQESGKIIYIPYHFEYSGWKRRFQEYSWPFFLYRKMRKVIKENGPYVAIHCHNYFEGAPCILAAAKENVPIRILHSHNVAMPIEKQNILRKAYKKVYQSIIEKYTTNRIGCSRAACEYLFGNQTAKVINNGINLNVFQYAPSDLHEGIRIIHIGRMSLQKNQIFLVKIFKEICKISDEYFLTMIGSGGDLGKVKELVDEYDLSRKVSFLPPTTNISKELKKSDLMVFPSTYEGLGIVLIEAQAVGVPCIVSDKIQPEAYLGNCFTVSLEQNEKEWAEQIIELRKKGMLKRKKVDMSTFDMKNIIQEYRNIYNGECNKK